MYCGHVDWLNTKYYLFSAYSMSLQSTSTGKPNAVKLSLRSIKVSAELYSHLQKWKPKELILGIGAYPLSSERVFEIYLGPRVEPKIKNSIAPP